LHSLLYSLSFKNSKTQSTIIPFHIISILSKVTVVCLYGVSVLFKSLWSSAGVNENFSFNRVIWHVWEQNLQVYSRRYQKTLIASPDHAHLKKYYILFNLKFISFYILFYISLMRKFIFLIPRHHNLIKKLSRF